MVERVILEGACQDCGELVGALYGDDHRFLGWLHAHGTLHCRSHRRPRSAFFSRPPGMDEREYKKLWMRRHRIRRHQRGVGSPP